MTIPYQILKLWSVFSTLRLRLPNQDDTRARIWYITKSLKKTSVCFMSCYKLEVQVGLFSRRLFIFLNYFNILILKINFKKYILK
jgi:hypothetical protein